MAKYQKPEWNLILRQNHTHLHLFNAFLKKKSLTFSLTSVKLGLRSQALSPLKQEFVGDWASFRGFCREVSN